MANKYSVTYVAEGPDPSISSIFVDSKKFTTPEEAMAFGERVYKDAFSGTIQVSGDEPF